MAKMTVPSSAADQPTIVAGMFGINEPVRIQQAAIENIVRDDPSQGKYLRIRVAVPNEKGLVFVSTNGRFRDNCSFEPNSGSKATQFLKQLGFPDPQGAGFDLDGLPGTEVVVEVGCRTYVDKQGETRTVNWIKNISRKV